MPVTLCYQMLRCYKNGFMITNTFCISGNTSSELTPSDSPPDASHIVLPDAAVLQEWVYDTPAVNKHHQIHLVMLVTRCQSHCVTRCCGSASARISKGQGYQGFLRKRAGSNICQKRAICVVQGKTWKMDRISLLLGSIKYFPLSFNTFKQH
jgi:hypothetical protein